MNFIEKFLKFLITAFVLCFFAKANAQWQPDVRLTYWNSTKWNLYNNKWNIAAEPSGVLHVIWDDTRAGAGDIFYKRSSDNGTTWSADVNLSNDMPGSGASCITSSGTNVYVAWVEFVGGSDKIFFKPSANSGITWSANVQLTSSAGASEYPCISSSDSNVHVVWHDNRDGNDEIYYKRSTDYGLTWSADTRLTIDGGNSRYASVSSVEPYVHVVWYDDRDYNSEIYYKRSTDNGATWSADTRLTYNSDISTMPCVSFSGSNVHVTWFDFRDGTTEIYYKRSTNYGVSWSADQRLTFNPALKGYPNIAAFGVNVHIAWHDERDGNYEIYYKNSTDGGNTFSPDTRLTNAPGNSSFASVAFNSTYIHLVWLDERNVPTSGPEIYYKRNPTGNNITGIGSNNSGTIKDFKLEQNYPNPFNPSTNIRYQIARSGKVRLAVYNLLGEEVAVLVNEVKQGGAYELLFDASNLSSGTYFYKLETGEITETKRMMLIK